jgi:feruloyl esterase
LLTLASGIQYPELALGASYGFASFGTNAGHNGTSGGALYQQPDVLEDFVWRAVYTGANVGKSISKQFYGKDCGKSYYIGCSSGGRQGFKAVQQNPELFDGVVAGAPAVNILAHLAWFATARESLGFSANSSLLSIEQWAAVQKEALNQCDALDGASDGILEDPTACKFDWKPLVCTANSNSSSVCLTMAQVEGAAKLFAPVTFNGTFLHSGHLHGYETDFITFLYLPLVTDWINEAFRYLVYEDLFWDFASFTTEDAFNAVVLNPGNISSFEGDISAFRNRGGKILHWHGTADQLLSMGMSDLYYNNVRMTLNASVAELDDFYRYFRASGVGHCSGGPGANYMGQTGGTAASDHPNDNMLMRMVAWVENGEAPEFVRGTKFVNDTTALGIEFTRKHCKYPRVNMYKGTGNGTDEEGWECVEPSTL